MSLGVNGTRKGYGSDWAVFFAAICLVASAVLIGEIVYAAAARITHQTIDLIGN